MFTRLFNYNSNHRVLQYALGSSILGTTTYTLYNKYNQHNTVYADTQLQSSNSRSIAHLDIDLYNSTLDSPHSPGRPNLPPTPEGYDLIQVQVIHRHGARTPMVDPVDNKASWRDLWGMCNTQDHQEMPCGRGQLTPIGEQQLIDLGKQLNLLYVGDNKLLPSDYNPADYPYLLHSRSTDLFRTRISAARLLEGMFNNLTPIDIVKLMEVRDHDDETLFPNHKKCDKLRQIYAAASKRYMNIYGAHSSEQAKQLKHVLETAYHKSFDTTHTWIQVSDELRSREIAAHNLPPPITHNDSLLANLYAGVMMSYIIRGGHEHNGQEPIEQDFSDVNHGPVETEALTLGMGQVVKDISDNMKQAVLHPQSDRLTRFHQYSGHDTTMIPLAEVFGQGYLFGRSCM